MRRATRRSENRPVVITDVRMPPTHTEGIRAALVIGAQWPEIAILALSQCVRERHAADQLSANTAVSGYLPKEHITSIFTLGRRGRPLRALTHGERFLVLRGHAWAKPT